MPLKDALLVFNTAQAANVSGVSTDLIDLRTADPDIGEGTYVPYLNVDVIVAFAGTGTIVFKLQDCDTEGGTYVDVNASKSYDADVELTRGANVRVPLPEKIRRFVKVAWTVTGTLSAGSISSNLAIG